MHDIDSTRVLHLLRQAEVGLGILSCNDSIHNLHLTAMLHNKFLAVAPEKSLMEARRISRCSRRRPDFSTCANPKAVELRETLKMLFHKQGIGPRPSQELYATRSPLPATDAFLAFTLQFRHAHLDKPTLTRFGCQGQN